jgi:hypothetical protein
MDNGEAFMRARRLAQQAAQQSGLDPYNALPWTLQRAQSVYQAYRAAAEQRHPWTPGERPEPEDITGLRLLEEFLAKRKRNKGE